MSQTAPLIIGPNGVGFEEPDSDEEILPGWAIDAIVGAGLRMDRFGWVPATAGNLSVRLSDTRIAITRSGRHKGELTPDDIMLVDRAGASVATDARPSAETALHCQIYDVFPHAGAVLHGHSIAATVLSMALVDARSISFTDYEVLKAFPGQRTHQVTLDLPIIDNHQDMPVLAAALAPILAAGAPLGYLIRGHGVYAWGGDMKVAVVRLEALEFLLACELERRKLR